jgi:hypothetical protein
MYFSAHLWNANLMFVVGSMHLATAAIMRVRHAWWPTFLHALLVGLAFQIHSSAPILAILSVLLFARGLIRVHRGAVIAAVGVCILTLVPWVLAVMREPELLPVEKGFPFRGLLLVFPMLRGLLYWTKLASLSLASRMLDFDFASAVGTHVDTLLRPTAFLLGMVGHATLSASWWANWRLLRWIRRARPWRLPPPRTCREWLRRYVGFSLAAAVLAFAVSPTTVMFWQEFVVLAPAALVLIFSTEDLLRSRLRRPTLYIIVAWCFLVALLIVLTTLGAPAYRCGGWKSGDPDSMLTELGWPGACRAGLGLPDSVP